MLCAAATDRNPGSRAAGGVRARPAGWLGGALNGADTQFPATEKAVPNPSPFLFHSDILALGHSVS